MAVLPDGRPLVGRHVRLDPVRPDDLAALARILAEPAVYGSGYVMQQPPASPAEALATGKMQQVEAALEDK